MTKIALKSHKKTTSDGFSQLLVADIFVQSPYPNANLDIKTRNHHYHVNIVLELSV